MDIDKIRELIDLMKENELSEIRIVDGDNRLLLRRGTGPAQSAPAAAPPAQSPNASPGESAPGREADQETALTAIASPMVGTFYTAGAPDAEPYVIVGDRVKADTVVCIVEAMKVMNEIKAEINGTIKHVSAENGQAVEYGQPLFMVRPD